MEDARADAGPGGGAERAPTTHTVTRAPSAEALLHRARLAASLADLCARGSQPGALGLDGAASAQAVALYREAARWALAAAHPEVAPGTLAEEFNAAAEVWSSRVGVEALEAARRALVTRDADETFALDPAAQRDDAMAAARFTGAVIAALEPEASHRQALWARGLVGVAVLVTAALAAPFVRGALRTDLLRDARWRASSALPGFVAEGRGARVPVGGTPVFFHSVEEESPWVVFDLGAPRAVRGVEVVNREDCCAERASPLALELSADGRVWRQVAQRRETFRRWEVSLDGAPTRYLRLRAQRRTVLHLREVHAH